MELKSKKHSMVRENDDVFQRARHWHVCKQRLYELSVTYSVLFFSPLSTTSQTLLPNKKKRKTEKKVKLKLRLR